MILTAISEFGAQLLWQPVIGSWLDDARTAAMETGLAQEAAELAAGKAPWGK